MDFWSLRVHGRLGCALRSCPSWVTGSWCGAPLAQAGRDVRPHAPLRVTCRAGLVPGTDLSQTGGTSRRLFPGGFPGEGSGTTLCALQGAGGGGAPGRAGRAGGRPQAS